MTNRIRNMKFNKRESHKIPSDLTDTQLVLVIKLR